MSRTKKGSKGPGYDYWSRRPVKSQSGTGGMSSGYGPDIKRRTNRAERRRDKKNIDNFMG